MDRKDAKEGMYVKLNPSCNMYRNYGPVILRIMEIDTDNGDWRSSYPLKCRDMAVKLDADYPVDFFEVDIVSDLEQQWYKVRYGI